MKRFQLKSERERVIVVTVATVVVAVVVIAVIAAVAALRESVSYTIEVSSPVVEKSQH